MTTEIERILEEIVAGEDAAAVVGITDDEIAEICQAWGVEQLPAAYREFLRRMGREAGWLLRGTCAFYPEILELPEMVTEFFSEDEGGMPLPDDAVVFAMHQGYQVYWFTSLKSSNPEVVLYMERRTEPMETWATFDAFLESEYRSHRERMKTD